MFSICVILFILVPGLYTQNLTDYRLPKHLKTHTYHVTIRPNTTSWTFDGHVVLEFSAKFPSNCIILNMALIEPVYSTVQVLNTNTQQYIPLLQMIYNKELQRFTLKTAEDLDVGTLYELTINYTGPITDDGWGFYRSSYIETDNSTQWLMATQLRPVFARRLFPCLDEPEFRAEFILSVWHDPDFRAISNMPPQHIKNYRDWTVTTFEPTPSIPPFLVALMISRLPGIGLGVFTTYAIPDRIRGAPYSAQLGPRLVSAMESVTGIQYPAVKTDQVALPRLIPVAMENWALFNFRPEFILYEEGVDKTIQKQTVGRFSGHEVTHMWMGNSVTIAWWDYLWLSEVFAMFYEYYLPGLVQPSWHMMDQLVVDLHQLGLRMDALPGVEPLTTQVLTPTQISAKFGGVTYSKGPALLRMAMHILTEEKFIIGFREFLNKYWFKTVTPDDLWNTLEKSAGEAFLPVPLVIIMDKWTTESGYPVVSAVINSGTSEIILQQDRFWVDDTTTSESNKTWWIPISLTTKSQGLFEDTSPSFWFPPKKQFKITYPLIQEDWVILNLQSTGFYRVNYDNENWKKIIYQLLKQPKKIHLLNRAQLVDDVLNLARSGRLQYPIALDLTSYLGREFEYVPWASASFNFEFLNNIFTGTSLQEPFLNYLDSIIQPVYHKIGFDEQINETHLTKLLREIIVRWACIAQIRDCRTRSVRYVNALVAGSRPALSVDVIDTALCYGVKYGNENSFDYVLSRYKIVRAWEKPRYLNAIACTASPNNLKSFLLDEFESLTATEWTTRFLALAARPENIDALANILYNNQTTIQRKFGTQRFTEYLNAIAALANTRQQAEILNVLGSSLDVDMANSVNQVNSRISWLNRYKAELRQYFQRLSLVFN